VARIAVLLLLARAVSAQSIEGTLTNTATRAALPGIKVNLLGPASYEAVSDGAGIFRSETLRPGKYTVTVSAPGYTLNGSKPIEVSDATVRVSLALEPLSRIEGRVLYPDGSPAPRAALWLALYPAGGVIGGTSDGDGRFVFDGLGAGSFALRAAAPSGAPRIDGETWAPTFFPNALERSAAEPIRLRGGVPLSGYDIRLRSVPVRHLRGTVRDEVGNPAPATAVKLIPKEPNAGAEQTVQTDETGAFHFAARAAEWQIVATRKDGAVERKGFALATVSRSDVETLAIRLAVPFSIPVIVDGATMAFYLRAVDAPSEFGSMAFVQRIGSAAIANVYPGRYLIQPNGSVRGSYLASIQLGGREVLGVPTAIYDGGEPIRATFRPGAPHIRVQAENGEGATVVVVPQNWSTGDVSTAKLGPDGRFDFDSLGPGDYYVFAFDRFELRAVLDPAFLRGLISRAEKVHVDKGETASVDLKVTPWPE
jgi:hypothetical protein